jgi:hypothetical protein
MGEGHDYSFASYGSPHFVPHKMISEGLSALCLHNSYFILSAGGSPHFARGKMISVCSRL